MSPAHEVGSGPLPGPAPSLGSPAPSATRSSAARPGVVTDCAPHAPSDRELSARRVVRYSPDATWSALTDPWSLLVLHGAGTALSLDDAPWRLTVGDAFPFSVHRWGTDLTAILTITGAVAGASLSWTVTYRDDARTVHCGESWSATLERHPHGTWLDLSVDGTRLPSSAFGRRARAALRLRQAMSVRLREFDFLLTRHDLPRA